MNALDRPWVLIAEREITTKLRDKTFLGSTAVMLLIVMAATILPAVLAGKSGASKIGVIDDAGVKVVQQASATVDGKGYDVVRLADRPAAEKAVTDGDVKAVLLPGDDGYVVLGKDHVDSGIESALREAAASVGTAANAAKAGLSPAELHAGTKVSVSLLKPGPLPD
ncbi:MAG TPA: ABC transporter permease, partial [Kribbella sp.]|nr:ABC transporter permease [Kribbella sp.]